MSAVPYGAPRRTVGPVPSDEHLSGCPAALSIVGARDDCRCAELAARFALPTRDECLADPDPAGARARWSAARAESAIRDERLVHDLAAEEKRALDGYREAAAEVPVVERDIRRARERLAQMLADRLRLP